MGVVDTVLILGILGGGVAYVTNFQGFKDWVHQQIDSIMGPGGGGGGVATSACTNYRAAYPKATATQRAQTGALLVGVVILTYKATSVTTAKVQSAVAKMVTTDKNAMISVAGYMNTNCNNAQKLWTYLRSMAITYAKKYGIAIKPIPAAQPGTAAFTMISAYTRTLGG